MHIEEQIRKQMEILQSQIMNKQYKLKQLERQYEKIKKSKSVSINDK